MIKIFFRYFIIIFLSILISLYLFELYQNIYLGDNNINKKAKILWKSEKIVYDKRTKIEAFIDIKEKNSNLVSTIVPKTNVLFPKGELLPLSGISNSLTLHCNENGYYSLFESDRYGFNNPDEEWNKKNIDYLIVGDSFAMGECVNRPHDISSVLRKLSNKNVLNLAYSSNGPFIEYVVLREYLDQNVKNILWFFYEGNDLQDLSDTMNSAYLNRYIDDLNYKQNLKLKQLDIDILTRENLREDINYFIERDQKSKKYKILRFIRLDKTKKLIERLIFPEKKKEFNKKVYEKLELILKLSKDLAIKNDTRLYFIYLPSYYSFNDEDKNYWIKQKDEVELITSKLDIKFIDIKKELLIKNLDYKTIFPFGMQGHYNILGYKVISDIIINNLNY